MTHNWLVVVWYETDNGKSKGEAYPRTKKAAWATFRRFTQTMSVTECFLYSKGKGSEWRKEAQHLGRNRDEM